MIDKNKYAKLDDGGLVHYLQARDVQVNETNEFGSGIDLCDANEFVYEENGQTMLERRRVQE